MVNIYPTTAEMRRTNLQALVDENGGQAAVAARLDVTPAQINQWVKASPDSKTGKPRVIGDDSARRLEALFQRPHGWMDHDHTNNTVPADHGPPPSIEQALEVLGIALAREMPGEVREDLAEALKKLSDRKGAAPEQQRVVHLLTVPRSTTGMLDYVKEQSGKRRGAGFQAYPRNGRLRHVHGPRLPA